MTPSLGAFPMMVAVHLGAIVSTTTTASQCAAIPLSKPVRFAMAIAPSLVRTMMPAPPMCLLGPLVHATSPAPIPISVNVFTQTVAVLPAAITLTMMIVLPSAEITSSNRVNIVKGRPARAIALT